MKIILSEFMSLDGVVQAPGGAEEDTDGGFAHGGCSIEMPKYVASRTLIADDLTWSGSTLLPADDAIGAVRDLRARDGRGLLVMGSSALAAQLVEHDLVDEYRFMIEPILLGGGKRVFPGDGRARPLELVSTTTAATGVLVCTYRPASR